MNARTNEVITLNVSELAISPQMKQLTFTQRCFSLIELFVGILVVIGYNIYHVIPNEVLILFVLGFISLKVRDKGFQLIGLQKPISWGKTIFIALSIAILRILLSAIVIEPLTAWFWPVAAAPTGIDAIKGNITEALYWLFLVWTFAAFGEEFSYRGYLLARIADIGNRSKMSYWVGVLAVAVLFGLGHYYKGVSGMVDSGVAGLIFGSAYLLSGRNMWVSILAHGFVDTFGVIFLFFGADA